MVGWTGNYLLFVSERSGAHGLWGLRIREGKPEGAPESLKSPLTPFAKLGVSRSGVLYAGVQEGGPDIHVASIDFNSGSMLKPPVRAAPKFIGTRSYPDWSPDGKYLSYLSDRNGVGPRSLLVVQSMETGRTHELNVGLSYLQWPHWSADGRSFIAQGRDLKNRSGVWKIDAETGAVDALMLNLDG